MINIFAIILLLSYSLTFAADDKPNKLATPTKSAQTTKKPDGKTAPPAKKPNPKVIKKLEEQIAKVKKDLKNQQETQNKLNEQKNQKTQDLENINTKINTIQAKIK